MLSAVSEMLFADPMSRLDFEPTLYSYKRQVFLYHHAAVVEEHVVVGAQAQDVVCGVRPVVRGPERPDVGGLRVFPNTLGGPMDYTNLVPRHFKPLLRRAGLPNIRFHDLRHTCATLLLTKCVHPKIVSEMLGHSSVSITLDVYSHVIPGLGEAAALAMEDALGGGPAVGGVGGEGLYSQNLRKFFDGVCPPGSATAHLYHPPPPLDS